MDFKIKDDKIKKQRNTNKLDEKVQLLLIKIIIIHCCNKITKLQNYKVSVLYINNFYFRKRRKRKRFCNSMSFWIMLCAKITQGGEKIEYKLISGIINVRH